MKKLDSHYDIIVVGVGLTGIYTALESNRDLKILVLSMGDIKDTNSYLAQGGIAAAVSSNDDPKLHYEDTLKCGHYKNNKEAVKVLVEEGVNAIKSLESYGVEFDRDQNGYLFGLEGAHSRPRILRMGDHTGKSIVSHLYNQMCLRENVTHLFPAYVYKLILYGSQCHGVEVLLGNEKTLIYASHVVLATGGAGHLFKNTTNSESIFGSGIALGIEAGVKVRGLRKIQFHPTGFYDRSARNAKRFLISEAVRGEGAVLKNIAHSPFMENVHPLKDLAPRDVVSNAIHAEMTEEKCDYVYLDASNMDTVFFKQRFPTIHAHLTGLGLDPSNELIPVAPCMHYLMGGIETDMYGRTSIENLYAGGECACTGVHGENRLASNSLLESLVFAKRIASILDKKTKRSPRPDLTHIPLKEVPSIEMDLHQWMTNHMGIVQNPSEMAKLKTKLRDHFLKPKQTVPITWESLKTHHMLLLALAMLKEEENHDFK